MLEEFGKRDAIRMLEKQQKDIREFIKKRYRLPNLRGCFILFGHTT